MVENVQSVPMAENYIKIARIGELEPHGHFSKWVQDHDILVYKWKGGIKAISNICPHNGGPIGFHKMCNKGLFTCVWHNFQFSAEDGALVYPTEPKLLKFQLREYKLKVHGDAIWVLLEEA